MEKFGVEYILIWKNLPKIANYGSNCHLIEECTKNIPRNIFFKCQFETDILWIYITVTDFFSLETISRILCRIYTSLRL